MPLSLPPGEKVNTFTHGAACLLSTLGGVALLAKAFAEGDAWNVTGCLIFTAALVSTYGASTLSHAIARPSLRDLFRRLDQGLIYVLIVGTYTPFALTYLHTGWWWAFLAIMWTIAIVGMVSKIFLGHRVNAVTLWSYVMLGWMPVLPAWALIGIMPAMALWLILIGGLWYTSGTVFFTLDNPRYHHHGIWHLFVMVGSACHYWAVYSYATTANLTSPLQ